jgi:hypothetical protein
VTFPLEHPITPLLWQLFCNLYFERNYEPGPFFQKNFGSLFIAFDMELWNSLIATLSAAKDSPLIPKQSQTFFDAVHYWLCNHDLLKGEDGFQVPQEYFPSLLHSCMESTLLNQGAASWWIALIQDRVLLPSSSFGNLPMEPTLESPKLDPIKAVAIVEQPEEILSSITSLEMAQVMLEEELTTLKNQGRYHSTYLRDHNEKDIKYLEDVQKLYLNETTSSTITKQCSGNCLGVTIQFKRNQTTMIPAISHSLEYINSQISACCTTEFVDKRTAMAGMRIRAILKFVKTSTISKQTKILQFFYSILELIEMKLHAFPPADILMNEILEEFGILI